MLRLTRVIGLIVLTLAAVGAWASAQVIPQKVVPPVVLAGPDVGFRIEAYKGTTPVGRIVVRIDGQWVEAQFPVGFTRLETR